MRRREVLTLIAGVLVWPLAARAQQSTKVARIGYLSSNSEDTLIARRNIGAFRQGLQDLGLVDGQNIAIEYRFANGNVGRLASLASELVGLNVDVIVAAPTTAAIAAKNATRTIPIVIHNVGNPVGVGLVSSLARPDGNVTGVPYGFGLETIVKGLELLKELLRDLQGVAVLSNPDNPAHSLVKNDLEVAARRMGVQLQPLGARGPDDFAGAFAAMAKESAEALIVVADALFVLHADQLAKLCIKHQLPSVHGLRENVVAGGLMFYGPDTADQARSAATFVVKILQGAKPADLPMQQPTKFELVINARTARMLSLEIPPTLLARADEVIE